jgi:chaperone LolA
MPALLRLCRPAVRKAYGFPAHVALTLREAAPRTRQGAALPAKKGVRRKGRAFPQSDGGRAAVKVPRAFQTLLREIFLGLLSIMLVVTCAPAQKTRRNERARGTDSIIERVESRYGRMRGLAAEFEQTYRAPGARERRERGRLFLQRPRRMRWEYDPKPGKLFIVNQNRVWFYVPADREAVFAETNASRDARFPFLFLLGQMNLRRQFRSIELVDQGGASPDVRVLRLVPRSNAYGLREILLEVFTDGRISKVKLLEETGAVSEVALTNVRENFVAPAEAFEFHPPSGVTVRRQK